MGERVVPELAGAVLDGAPIDWAGAESRADDASRPVLAELRVLAALADVHRRLPVQDKTAPSILPGDQDGALTHWGHLRALECIGRGAFGDVYRAWDTRLDREVALKLIDAPPTASDDPPSSIIQEGKLLARVRHPNVVTIYGAEQIGTRIGLWMEFVRGRTLKQIVDGGKRFSGPEAVQIGIDLCQAVAAVHGAGVLHRDIKAQNVMLEDEGRAVLMDFGTGREVADNGTDVAGTPLYLAPEVLAGGDATVESDIYSLGVLLYHLVTGSYPVRAESVSDLRQAHERDERIPIRTARGGSDVSPKLGRIIERAIDPRPDGRYASADALAADLAGLQPRPARARLPYAIAVAAVLLLVATLGWEAVSRRMGSSRTPGALLAGVFGPNAGPTGKVIPSQPIVAVLPFRNLSAEPGSDDFVDGLTDEITRNLVLIRGLQVRSRGSSFAFKDKPRDIPDVGRQLGVNLVVDGSVLRLGNKLRVDAQLILVAGNALVWSESFDKEIKDVFAIQDDISQGIARELRLTLGRKQRRSDIDVEAYELYLEGRELVGRRSPGDLEKAAELFEQVLVKDPEYAPAHAQLAIAHALHAVPSGSPIPFAEAQSIIRPAAEKALELDPTLADAHEAMGWVRARERDWSSAEKSFERAIVLNPSLTQTYTSYSLSTLRPLGKRDDALRHLRVALKNDPISLDVQREIAFVQSEAGRYEEAIETFQHVLAVDPGFPGANEFLARALVFAGRPADALPVFERAEPMRPQKAPSRRRGNPRMILAYVALGRRADAEALAAEHVGDASPSMLATIYTALGDKDRAFEALERAAHVEPHRLPFLLAYPEMAPLRGDPRLVALRQRLRLPPQ
jgi:serine/threonine-protein kinase